MGLIFSLFNITSSQYVPFANRSACNTMYLVSPLFSSSSGWQRKVLMCYMASLTQLCNICILSFLYCFLLVTLCDGGSKATNDYGKWPPHFQFVIDYLCTCSNAKLILIDAWHNSVFKKVNSIVIILKVYMHHPTFLSMPVMHLFLWFIFP